MQPRALSQAERARVRELLNTEPYLDHAPATVWAKLLDAGEYYCSISTMYRILCENGEVRERRRQATHPPRTKPELIATGPNGVWSRDITKLAGPCRGVWYHLYVITDIYSRYTPGWMIAHSEDGDLARRFLRESITFDSIGHAREFCAEFFQWYNHDHRHSGIGLHTPASVHFGTANEIRQQRATVLTDAYTTNPERFVRGTPQPPKLPSAVWINRPTEEQTPTNQTK